MVIMSCSSVTVLQMNNIYMYSTYFMKLGVLYTHNMTFLCSLSVSEGRHPKDRPHLWDRLSIVVLHQGLLRLGQKMATSITRR